MTLNIHKTLLTLSLLGTTTSIGFAPVAEAKPKSDVKEARKEVERARRDVRRADSPEERRDAREDLREEQRDLNEERREQWRRDGRDGDWNRDRGYRDRGGFGRGDGRPGYGYGRPDYSYNRPGNGYGRPSNGYGRPSNGYGRPGFERPTYTRPNYDRPNYDRPDNFGGRSTLQGVVTNDLKGDDFVIRTSSGQSVRVYAARGESGAISRGDTVRVSGDFVGGAFRARSISIIRNR